MRSTLLAGTVALLVGTVSPLAAQSASTWRFGLGAGLTAPFGDIRHISKVGVHGMGLIGYRAAGSRAEWALDLGYHNLANKLVDGESNHMVTAMARVNYDMGTNTYLIGGIGAFRNEYTEPRVEPVITNTKAAAAVTGGLGLSLGSRLFGEARVLLAFTDGGMTTLVPVTIGMRF